MVTQTIHATYTETYDLNTALNELSLLAIHTPQAPALKKMFKGFFEQYKKYKILGCNLQMVCASQQSLTPDLVGLSEGQADPRDILNPILFKACTGENLNVLLNQIYNESETINNTGGSSIASLGQHVDTRPASINAYYQLMADNDWRKEHPQKGLTVMGLRPMVHKVVTTQPFAWTGYNSERPLIDPNSGSSDNPDGNSYSIKGFGGVSGTNQNVTGYQRNGQVFVSNGMVEMPWLDTTFDYKTVVEDSSTSEDKNVKANVVINSVPRVYMGIICLPPARLMRLFYRCQIVWHVAFKDFRPAYEVGPLDFYLNGTQQYNGICSPGDPNTPGGQGFHTTYWNLYHNATPSELGSSYSSFDANGLAEVETVNEKVQ